MQAIRRRVPGTSNLRIREVHDMPLRNTGAWYLLYACSVKCYNLFVYGGLITVNIHYNLACTSCITVPDSEYYNDNKLLLSDMPCLGRF